MDPSLTPVLTGGSIVGGVVMIAIAVITMIQASRTTAAAAAAITAAAEAARVEKQEITDRNMADKYVLGLQAQTERNEARIVVLEERVNELNARNEKDREQGDARIASLEQGRTEDSKVIADLRDTIRQLETQVEKLRQLLAVEESKPKKENGGGSSVPH